MAFTVFLLGLLAFAGFQMHLKDRARRDLVALASRIADSGGPLPPEMLDKLLADAGRIEIPRWIISLLLLAPAVLLAFAASALEAGQYTLALRAAAGIAAGCVAVGAVVFAVLRPRTK
jgi:hypothetical protein